MSNTNFVNVSQFKKKTYFNYDSSYNIGPKQYINLILASFKWEKTLTQLHMSKSGIDFTSVSWRHESTY